MNSANFAAACGQDLLFSHLPQGCGHGVSVASELMVAIPNTTQLQSAAPE